MADVCALLLPSYVNSHWCVLSCASALATKIASPFSSLCTYKCSETIISITPPQLELRNTTTLFMQVIFSSVQYFGILMFGLVEFCKDIPFLEILWQPICWANNSTNQKNSGENWKLLWWGIKLPRNWFDVSLPLNLKEEKFLFTLIGARCNGKENP